jgi:hypothetical protein
MWLDSRSGRGHIMDVTAVGGRALTCCRAMMTVALSELSQRSCQSRGKAFFWAPDHADIVGPPIEEWLLTNGAQTTWQQTRNDES